ncbi:FAD-dependent oxidoreductase [Terricaulis silvestris]|uniref:D-amino-acid oxidase n=1 Tax=Terricaulis silvestris TaxID=2686094 RepID=A0A6I6MN62_9CAUL|nr:FAD-dependent oxidoreductase [Terricaulis silvestris]QGZ94384.1 glycine oxidase ThiO [Terricaulis silvestris]
MRDLGHAPRERVRLAPVIVDESRIIRIDVGLRPFRPSGFRVEREALGDKVLAHNYGHGGGGITLSWGSAKQAVDLGFDSSKPDCAVLGCGAVGLATAALLQQRGARVRIYAKDLPPNTTSNVAGAQWWPASVYDHDVITDAYRAQHVEAARFAYRRYQGMVGGGYGVEWEANYNLSNRPITTYPSREDSPMRALVANQRDLGHEEHNFGAPYVRRFDTMMIETPLYLRRMEADVRLAGAEIVVREFADVAQVRALPERTIFNCTGLGAGALFGDREIMPVRGQLVILLPQPEVDYNVIASEGYMFGRRDGIVLGGTFDRGEWSLEPDPDAIAGIIRGHKHIFGAMDVA